MAPDNSDIESLLTDDRTRHFFTAIRDTAMPMCVTDPHQEDNPIIFVNDAFIALTGYSFSDITGKNCRFLQGPNTDLQTKQEIAVAIAEEREITIDILNYRKDGSPFWNALFISPIRDPEDNSLMYFLASQLNVPGWAPKERVSLAAAIKEILRGIL